MEAARISLQGDRANNQDRCAIFNHGKSCLMVLADGLGGHPKGEVAAQIMLNVCEQLFSKTPKPISSPRFFFHHCVAHAHKLINQYGQAQRPSIAPRTTMVMALIQDGYCYWSYAGDSRFYLLRDNDIVLQSTDHSVPQRGVLGKENASNRALTRCVGGQRSAPMPSTEPPFPLQPNDLILLCSDGLWNQLPRQQLVETLWNVFPLKKALYMLGAAAENNAQSRSDNISALGVRIDISSCASAISVAEEGENELLSAIDHLNALIRQNIPETE
ncbi:PP2C family protein-serine/threonine phosphatase [Thiolapillus sp.]